MTASGVDVAALEAALEKALRLPWAQQLGDVYGLSADQPARYRIAATGPNGEPVAKDEAELIVAAVNAASALVALVRAVEALADEYRADGLRREALGRPAWPLNVATRLRSAVGAALNPQETGR